MNDLEKYYNKFNEDKRLKTRHGQVEMFVCLNYIKKYIAGRQNLNILDIGAGTGAYTKALAEMGHNVVAVEPVKKNFSVLKQNCPTAQLFLGDARNLRKLKDESFDIVLLFGPLYHLKSEEDKMQAIMEAKRVAKKGAILMNMFLM
ncbi:MAG: methyltransferase domain-containing protein, partial [Clostridia bacterium]|nr:methyltransferase domain-containing protein [Clostridia bacterium]